MTYAVLAITLLSFFLRVIRVESERVYRYRKEPTTSPICGLLAPRSSLLVPVREVARRGKEILRQKAEMRQQGIVREKSRTANGGKYDRITLFFAGSLSAFKLSMMGIRWQDL
jgi:hypothetical protein